MSWRAESTFKPSSALTDEEKEYLKLVKKIREILKLEGRQSHGEALEELQLQKLASREQLLKEVTTLAVKLPGETEVLEKSKDITDLLSVDVVSEVYSRRQKDQVRRERREKQEVIERDRPEFMVRHDKPIMDVACSADGQHLFTCAKDKYVLCWSMRDKLLQVVCTFGGHKGAVYALDAAPSGAAGLVSGGADGTLLFWQSDPARLKPGSIVSPVGSAEHGGMVRVLRWCPFDRGDKEEGRRLASASEKLLRAPDAIRVWRVSAGGKAESLLQIDDKQILPGKANDLRWGGGAKTKLFSCHDNGYVGVWLAEAPGSLLKTLRLHTAPIISLALSGDGATLVTASHDASLTAVDVSKPSTDTLQVYKANRPLNAVCLTSDFQAGARGSVVVAGGKNARDVTTEKTLEDEFDAKVLDAKSGAETAAGRGHFGPVHRLLALPALADGYATVSETGCLKVHGLDGSLLHSDSLE